MSSITEKVRQVSAAQVLAGGLEGDARQVLAAKSLVQLSSQFAADADLERLVESLALTVAGQFAVGNVFAAFSNPDSRSSMPILFAGGQFHQTISPQYASELIQRASHLPIVGGACLVSSLSGEYLDSFPTPTLAQCGVEIVTGLRHRDRIIGLIGFGQRFSRKPFTQMELSLIDLLVQSVSPLVANAFMVAELGQQAAWYRDILNSVRHGVIVIGLDQNVRSINRTAETLLHEAGVTKKPAECPFLGTALTELLPGASFPGWVERVLGDDNSTTRGRATLLPSIIAGEERLFSLSTGILPASGTQETCLLLTFQDVTQQKQSEQRLFELEKFAERGMMASAIAHELNNFLGLILGGSELAAVMLQRQQFERVATSLEKLKENALKMQRFTAGLTDYSRMNTTKQRANLNTIITDVISFVSMQKRFVRISVETLLSNTIPEFDMDQDQMAQLIINMLNNAADAIQETGRADGKIVVVTEFVGDGIRLAVSDNGGGMTEEVKNTLFRTHITTKPKGHGYGLMVCSRIITNHDGTVHIDSALGQGSTISIQFRIFP